jgi:endonuclease YncB( thermonuclease family)
MHFLRKSPLLALFLFLGSFNPIFAQIKEQVRIQRVKDGDTVELSDTRVLRLANINSPEKESLLYKKSLEYLAGFAGKRIEIESLGLDLTGKRLVSRIYSSTNYINLALVREGYASKFLVQKGEEKIFAEAEREAINHEKGIWKKSRYFQEFEVKIDAKQEEVVLTRTSKSKSKADLINLEGWTIKDESREIFTFPKINVRAGDSLRVFSGKATKTQRNLKDREFIWTSENIWNNDRDTFYLLDEKGYLVLHRDYGYDK